jgi:4'-phosphopantetheinyl transferase EntD
MPKETRGKVMHASTTVNPAVLSTTIQSLFPSGVVAAELRVPGEAALLLPEEAVSVANAVPKRIQEFAAGRLCARRALEEFGISDFPVRMASDRQPVWPESLIGSITHTVGLCAAVIAERTLTVGLGLDTEAVSAVKKNLWPAICSREERAWIESLPSDAQGAAATFIFCAKEAFYKFQYPLVAQRLSFHDVSVTALTWGALEGGFAIVPTRPIVLFDRARSPLRSAPPVLGSYRFHEQFVSAAVSLAISR